MTGKTESLAVKCHACPNRIEISVTLGFWHDRVKYCADRAAEILGFTLTEKGPACPVHGEKPP